MKREKVTHEVKNVLEKHKKSQEKILRKTHTHKSLIQKSFESN